jgi:phospholipid/cholesterol/gamma-HCH transport system permease protein
MTAPAAGEGGRAPTWSTRAPIRVVAALGDFVRVLGHGLLPGNWRRTMREEFRASLYRVGVEGVPAVVVAGLLVGLGLVAQLMYWLAFAGEQDRIGQVLVVTLVREIGPMVTALILIGRSGVVVVEEIGSMRRGGQLDLLASHGVDPVELLLLPRAFAFAVSAFLLTVVFVHTALWSAYLVAAVTDVTAASLPEMVRAVLGWMDFGDHLLLLVKPLLVGYVIGYLAVRLGMQVALTGDGVRRALPRAFLLSLLAAFAVGAVVSLLL